MDNIKLLNVPYGATELKAVAPKYTFRGFISALAIYALVAGGLILKGYLDSTADVPETISKPVVILDIETMVPPSIKEPEQPQEVNQQNAPAKNDEALTPVPTSRQEAEIQTTLTTEQLDDINTDVSRDGIGDGVNNNEGTAGIIPETPEIPVKEPETPVVEDLSGNFTVDKVQKSPNALNLGDVQRGMEYPDMAVEQGIEGRVTVKVLVDRNGNVIRIGSMSGNSVFHDEVERNVRDLNFEPAIKNGQPVNCWVTVPFTFKLSNKFK